MKEYTTLSEFSLLRHRPDPVRRGLPVMLSMIIHVSHIN